MTSIAQALFVPLTNDISTPPIWCSLEKRLGPALQERTSGESAVMSCPFSLLCSLL